MHALVPPTGPAPPQANGRRAAPTNPDICGDAPPFGDLIAHLSPDAQAEEVPRKGHPAKHAPQHQDQGAGGLHRRDERDEAATAAAQAAVASALGRPVTTGNIPTVPATSGAMLPPARASPGAAAQPPLSATTSPIGSSLAVGNRVASNNAVEPPTAALQPELAATLPSKTDLLAAATPASVAPPARPSVAEGQAPSAGQKSGQGGPTHPLQGGAPPVQPLPGQPLPAGATPAGLVSASGTLQAGTALVAAVPVGASMQLSVVANGDGTAASVREREKVLPTGNQSAAPAMGAVLAVPGGASQPLMTGASAGTVPPPAMQQVIQAALSQAVLLRQGQSSQMQLRLRPPELGEMRVEFRRDLTGHLSVHLIPQTAAASAVLQDHQGQLQAALAHHSADGQVTVTITAGNGGQSQGHAPHRDAGMPSQDQASNRGSPSAVTAARPVIARGGIIDYEA